MIRPALFLAALCVPAIAAAQTPPERSQDAAWHNRQMLAIAERHQADGWRVLDGGVRLKRIASDGSGAHPTVADRVRIHYAGRYIDGTEFDSSYARGEPVTFQLGKLIKAWQIAVPEMGVGDTVEIAVPPDVGYGPLGKRSIPGGATLLFKIELLAINPDE